MFKKTMTFDDLEGNEVTDTFYFNFTKKEIVEMLLLEELEEKIDRLTRPVEETGLTQQENTQQAYDTFQNLILRAYGVKGDDNVTFRKSDELRDRFRDHVAFVDIIFEFIEKPELAAEFIEKCVPPKLLAAAKREAAPAPATYTSEQIREMTEEASRRQEDPATRIEPGLENVPEGLRFAESRTDGLTDEEILSAKPRSLTKAQLQRAMFLANS